MRRAIRCGRAIGPFILPAVVMIAAVIIFPWVFTLWMSVNEWKLGGSQSFVGLANYARLAGDVRFWESMLRTAATPPRRSSRP